VRRTDMKAGPRLGLVVTSVALAFAACAPPAGAASSNVRFDRIEGFHASGTPSKLNKVGVLETGPKNAKNVLVLNPGTSASAAYFEPLAKTIVKQAPGWQVWAVERRENLLEDHSVANQAKAGKATPNRLFDYYLGYLNDPSVTSHFKAVPDADVPFARKWGMRVSVEDLRRVVRRAQSLGGKVVVGGHSLGGSITSAYATWDFGGKPGAKGLAGLVFIDGGSSPTPVTREAAQQSLQEVLDPSKSPWLSFGGIPAPLAGLFNIVAATTVKLQPNAPSKLQDWALLPANLKPPVRTTALAGYAYSLDSSTSPPSLRAAQAHLGHLAASGDPRGWDRAGALTPVQRFADMFSGTGLKSLDGTAWYHPRRLTIDSGAVAAGNANPAQKVLDVRATHGADLPKGLRIYAFGAALGGPRVLNAARALASQSHISSKQLILVDRHASYAHNDPNSASPKNDFVKNLIPFLAKVSRK
jgi:pimeloyl-ACP methyl ester carboxylesterase